MKHLARWILPPALAVSMASAQNLNQLTPTERDSGFALLFDGTRIDPLVWKKWNGALHGSALGPQWSVKEGVMEKSGQGGNPMIDSFYNFFVFKMEFRVYSDNPAGSREGNSGVFYRTMIGHGAPQATGVEYQIRDILQSTPQATGALYGGIAPSPYPWKSGEWNSLEIHATPDSAVRHILNTRQVVKYKFGTEEYYTTLSGSGYSQGKYKDPETGKEYLYGRNLNGYLVVQDYGDDMHLYLRNIKVRRLPMATTGLRDAAGAGLFPGRIEAADGAIRIDIPGGPAADIRIASADGRLVHAGRGVTGRFLSRRLESGIYLVRVQAPGRTVLRRVAVL
jgi:hypothetical protein